MSYVRSDDDHDNGNITLLRQRLEGELRMQLGKPFPIFQDRNDISWGQNWLERIDKSLHEVTFLFPIVTPSFFESQFCRKELDAFCLRERQLGVSRLIMPIYYVTCDQLSDSFTSGIDEIADVLRSRHWTDWRQHRFRDLNESDVSASLAEMAMTVKAAMIELEREIDAAGSAQSKTRSKSSKRKTPPKRQKTKLVKPTESFTEEILEAWPEGTKDQSILNALRSKPYFVFTKTYDEEIRADALAQPEDLLKLHYTVDTLATKLKPIASKGLDALEIAIGRKKKLLSVSILLDNSGSMRGSKIHNLAAWSSIFGEQLERLGIQTEILGYTTRAWKGGASKEKWLVSGKPKQPGRLNDLRHIIYKEFSESWRDAAVNLGLMIREDLLKENIDGEALLWAYGRLQERPTRKKLLVVISDGAPVDDSTLSVNRADFLSNHLRFVANMISQQSDVTLFAIGIDCDISRYFEHGEVVQDTADLGRPFFDAVSGALTSRK